MAVHVQSEDFDPAALIVGLTAGRTDIGGLATFIGQVRDENKGPRITSLTLEHYPGMTEKELAEATEEYERNRWLLVGLSVLSGIGTFVVGLKLFEHWGYAAVTLALGPVIVAYYFLYKANLATPPSPKMPS